MADPEAEKRKRESEKKAKDRETLTTKHSNERLKASQDAKKAKIALAARQKRERESMNTEASTKANKLFIMHSAKQIGKEKDDEERERQVTDLEQKAKKMGFKRDWIERTLEKQGAYGESYDILKQEADRMHSYVNTLSLERSVNLWAEAAKSKEESKDPEPVKGSKTLTKKTQEKVTINPIEKEPHPSNRHK